MFGSTGTDDIFDSRRAEGDRNPLFDSRGTPRMLTRDDTFGSSDFTDDPNYTRSNINEVRSGSHLR